MEAEGIITGYWTAINTYRLGYYVFRIYINFLDVSKSKKEEIINYFCDAKNVWAVLSLKGPIDLDVILWVDDVFEFNMQWERTLQKYGTYFSDATVSILTEVLSCKNTYLLPNNTGNINRKFYVTNCQGHPVKIDALDYQLLDVIALDARAPVIDLADKLDCSSQTVNYHLKKLMNQDIIKAYRVSIDDSKLGYQTCAIDVYLKNPAKKGQLIENAIKNPYTFDLMTKTIGWSDLCMQLVIQNMDSIFQIMDEVERAFPDAVRKQNYYMSLDFHKVRWLPEMSEKDFKS